MAQSQRKNNNRRTSKKIDNLLTLDEISNIFQLTEPIKESEYNEKKTENINR